MPIKIWPTPDGTDANSFSMREWFKQAWRYVKKTIFIDTDGKVILVPDSTLTSANNTVNNDSSANADLELRCTNNTTTPRTKLRLKGGNSDNYYWLDINEEFYDTVSGNMRWNIDVNSFSGRGGLTTAQTALQINGSGLITLPYGRLQFPTAQNASTDANTLDDYEEGTWTPTYTGSTGAGSFTYSIQSGNYIKIGGSVFFSGRVAISAISVNPTGNMLISGLPFVNNSGFHASVTIGYSAGWNACPMGALIVPGSTLIDLYKITSTASWTRTPSLQADFIAGADIIFSGAYYTG